LTFSKCLAFDDFRLGLTRLAAKNKVPPVRCSHSPMNTDDDPGQLFPESCQLFPEACQVFPESCQVFTQSWIQRISPLGVAHLWPIVSYYWTGFRIPTGACPPARRSEQKNELTNGVLLLDGLPYSYRCLSASKAVRTEERIDQWRPIIRRASVFLQVPVRQQGGPNRRTNWLYREPPHWHWFYDYLNNHEINI
jgi:hypothetical protein